MTPKNLSLFCFQGKNLKLLFFFNKGLVLHMKILAGFFCNGKQLNICPYSGDVLYFLSKTQHDKDIGIVWSGDISPFPFNLICILLSTKNKFTCICIQPINCLVVFLNYTGNPQLHIGCLQKAASKACTGEPSLQNAIDSAVRSLRWDSCVVKGQA